jgi:hypothetical protein
MYMSTYSLTGSTAAVPVGASTEGASDSLPSSDIAPLALLWRLPFTLVDNWIRFVSSLTLQHSHTRSITHLHVRQPARQPPTHTRTASVHGALGHVQHTCRPHRGDCLRFLPYLPVTPSLCSIKLQSLSQESGLLWGKKLCGKKKKKKKKRSRARPRSRLIGYSCTSKNIISQLPCCASAPGSAKIGAAIERGQ